MCVIDRSRSWQQSRSRFFFFFKQKTAYDIMPSLVGSEMCIRDRYYTEDVKMMVSDARVMGYEDPFDVPGGYEATFYDAGHIPGSAMVHIQENFQDIEDDGDADSSPGMSLVYTGDVNMTDTRLLYGHVGLPDSDILIMESTYFGVEHTPRKELEEDFVDS